MNITIFTADKFLMKRKKIVLENLPVTGYAAEGKALGRVEGKVIFVEGAVPGDVADVFITRNKKDWAEGKVITIKEYSKERVEPFCIHFGVCGGCKWQMLPYAKQLTYKQQEATDAFKRIGRLEVIPILPIIGSENTIHYRNKLEFTFSNKKFLTHGQFEELGDDAWPGGALGYHVPRLYDKIIDIFECWLMDDINNMIRNTLRDFSLANKYSYYFVNPFVRIEVINRRAYVYRGRSGAVPVILDKENMNMLEVIAKAGGVPPGGKAYRVRVLRGDLNHPTVFDVDLSTVEGMMQANLAIVANDVIYIQSNVTSNDVLIQITPVLTFISTILLIATTVIA